MGADGVKSYQAKFFYVALLGIGTLLAFLFAKIGEDKAEGDDSIVKTPVFKFSLDCSDVTGQGKICSGDPAILRASFASVLFFSAMLLGTCPVPTFSGDKNWRPLLGEGFHRGFWGIKILLYFGLVIGSFYFKFFDDEAYTNAARFFGMLFLIMQVLVLIDFSYTWDESWVARADLDNDYADGSQFWIVALIGLSACLYIAGFGGFIAILVLYNGCTSTIAIAATLMILAIVGIVLMVFQDKIFDDSDRGGSIAPPAVVTAYLSYLAFSATQSNPDTGDECDPFGLQLGENRGEIALAILIATVSLVWTSYALTGNSEALLGGTYKPNTSAPATADLGGAYQIEDGNGGTKFAGEGAVGNDIADEDEPEEKLWMFHLIMISASFYMAMILTNWGVSEEDVAAQGAQIGNISMYVKATAGWVAGLLFIWSILAPFLLPDRFGSD